MKSSNSTNRPIQDYTSNSSYKKYQRQHYLACQYDLLEFASKEKSFDTLVAEYDEVSNHAVAFNTFRDEDPHCSRIVAYYPKTQQLELARVYCNLQVLERKRFTVPSHEKVVKQFTLNNGFLAFVTMETTSKASKAPNVLLRIFKTSDWQIVEKLEVQEKWENDLFPNLVLTLIERKCEKDQPESYRIELTKNGNMEIWCEHALDDETSLCDLLIECGLSPHTHSDAHLSIITTKEQPPFVELISISILGNYLVLIANTTVHKKPGCVCLLINVEDKKVIQTIEIDYRI